jgi:hypothetical protein
LTAIAVRDIGLRIQQFRPLEAALHSIAMAPSKVIVANQEHCKR